MILPLRRLEQEADKCEATLDCTRSPCLYTAQTEAETGNQCYLEPGDRGRLQIQGQPGLQDELQTSQSHGFTLHKLSGPSQALICGSLLSISTEPKAWHKIEVGG